MFERLTEKCHANLDPWECCGQDNYCKRGCHEQGGCTNGCIVPRIYARLATYEDSGLSPEEIVALKTARPLAEWHEDYGDCLWWALPVNEPPYCGSPLCEDWPGYHTHWTPLPPCPELAEKAAEKALEGGGKV